MRNNIHPTAIIDANVDLGEGNDIEAYTIIRGPTFIGNHNRIGPHVTIGTPGQDTRDRLHDSSSAVIRIGDHNIIREFTGIQKPCYGQLTEIKNRVFLMQSVHVPHDALIQDDVVITPMVALGGISRVLAGANLALGCTVHQYAVIGHYAIVAMGSAVVKNILPFSRHIPGKSISVNQYAIEKFGFEAEKEEIEAYVLRQINPVTEKIKRIADEFDFHCLNSRRGAYR